MALYIPRQASSFWSYDNWGTNPSTTIGTSVTSGTANAEGSWVQIASGTNIAKDVHSMYLQIHTGAASGNVRPALLDIGIDPAGGSSYVAVISDLDIGFTPALTVAGNREHFFPFKINAGSSVAARIKGRFSSAHRVAARFYGYQGVDGVYPSGSYSETYGATTISGTLVTPGNAADGSWVQLGTTTKPIWWWQMGYSVYNTTITAEYTYLELAVGDNSNKVTVFKMMHGGTTGETCGLAAQTQLVWPAAYFSVPEGTGVYVRARCNNAPDTNYYINVVGIGG